MNLSETKRRDLKIAGYIVLAMILEPVIILWPLACTLSGEGHIALWNARDGLYRTPDGMPDEIDQETRRVIEKSWLTEYVVGRLRGRYLIIPQIFICALFFILLNFPKFLSRVLSVSLDGFLAFVLIQPIITGVDIGLTKIIMPKIVMKVAIRNIYSIFGTGIFLGLWVGLAVEYFFFRGLMGKLLAGLSVITLSAVLTIVTMLFVTPTDGLFHLLGLASGLFLGVLLAALVMYSFRQISAGFTSTIKGFLKPWELETYSFWKAIAFFATIYVGVVLIFSLWFYTCYLEDAGFFGTEDTEVADWWDFIYFSFVTITTLGYGDIYPIHSFPQVLVILETVVGMGLVIGYLGIILQVAGRRG